MHYLIWIPDNGESAPKQAVFERVGLADHVDNAEAMPSVGPTGKQGTLFVWRRGGYGDFKVDPSVQTWIPAAAHGEWPAARYWVGIWNGKPVQAEDIARTYMRTGKVMQLGGMTWTIPAAKALEEEIKLMDDGSIKFEPIRRYAAYHAKACEIAALVTNGKSISYQDLFYFSVDTLRINYRITPEVADHLKLFSKTTLEELACIVVGACDG